MLKKRIKLLLDFLLQEDSYKTIEYYSDKLGVSVRTVHNYLNELDEFLKGTNKYIERKSGVGIYLKELNESNVFKKFDKNESLTILNRRILIMEKLLFKDSHIKINQLADEFYVSTSSIENDLKHIEKILSSNNDIKLIGSVKGVSLEGSEIDFQSSILEFIRYISTNIMLNTPYMLSEQLKILKHYFSNEIVEECSRILYSFIKENITAISDHYIENVLNVLIILTYRASNSFHILEHNNGSYTSKNVNKFFYESSAKTILSETGEALDIQFTQEEIDYLTTQLILNKIVVLPEEEDVKIISDDLINEVSKTLSVDFNENQKLRRQLESHIESMIYRLRHNTHTHNPFSEQIKVEFNVTFNTIWIVLSKYEKKLNIQFNEDEIAFLTMYFQAEIENVKKTKNVLILCEMGIATSTYIKNRIKNEISSSINFETASLLQADLLELSQFDLIISTHDINLEHPNVIIVSIFLNEKDIKNIRQALDLDLMNALKYMSNHETKDNVQKDTSGIFDKNFTFSNVLINDRQELIETICTYLINKKIVQEEYTNSVLKREKAGSTDLPLGVAIPHGNTLYVNKSNITIVTVKNKFKWDKYYTDIIIFISIAKDDLDNSRLLLSSIYDVISDKEKIEKIRKVTDDNQLFNIFRNSIYGGE